MIKMLDINNTLINSLGIGGLSIVLMYQLFKTYLLKLESQHIKIMLNQEKNNLKLNQILNKK